MACSLSALAALRLATVTHLLMIGDLTVHPRTLLTMYRAFYILSYEYNSRSKSAGFVLPIKQTDLYYIHLVNSSKYENGGNLHEALIQWEHWMPQVDDDERSQKNGTRGDSIGRREAAKPSSRVS
jgi:hypothetical protein